MTTLPALADGSAQSASALARCGATRGSRRAVLNAALAAGTATSPLWTLLTGCASGGGPPPAASAPGFDAWAEGLAADRVRLSPPLATLWQYFDGAEQQAMDRQLPSQQAGYFGAQVPLATKGLAQVQRFDAARLTASQRVEAATLRWSLQSALDLAPYEDHTFSFNQFHGTHLFIVYVLTSMHPMRRPSDVDTWLARLERAGGSIDEGRNRAQAALDRGLLPPRFIVERSRAQVAAFLAPAAAQNVLVAHLERRTVAMKDLGATQRQAVIARATALVETQVRPAYQRLGPWMDALLPRCGDDAGLWRLPGGEAAYAAALAANTTTTMSAREIRDVGLREVARIEAEMDRVLRSLGRTRGSVNERFAALENELQPPPCADPRPALLARYEAFVREAQERARPLFNRTPRAAVIVEREPALSEATAAANYNSPAPDGSRPGVFRVPLPGPRFEVMGMKSVTVHETVPGHHFQIALLQEQAALPALAAARCVRWRLGLCRRLGAVCRGACHRAGVVRRRPAFAAGGAGIAALPGPSPGGGHRAACLSLDAPAGHRLRHPGPGSGALRGLAGAGLLLHGGHAAHPGHARAGAPHAGYAFQLASLS